MKKLILTMLCSLIILQITARQKSETTFKTTNWLKFDAETPFAQLSAKQLVQNKHQLNLQKEDGLSLLKTTTDQLGYKHYRYQQTYKNIPVEGANYIIHEKNGKVKLANGKLVEQLNIETKAAISESAALQFALKNINATLYAWNVPAYEMMLQQVEQDSTKSFYPCGELVIVDTPFQQHAINYRLAYKFDIYAVEPLSRQMVYVDAQNGNILTTLEQIKNSDVPASGTSNYSDTINFTADFTDDVYTLKQNNPVIIQVFSANNTRAYPQIPITSETDFLSSDPTANEVFWATEFTYKYFKDTLGRNSLDNNNMPLFSWVHFGKDYNNAFWNGNWMTYGDGDNKLFGPLTAIDVIAHEITHGIIEYEADLVYRGEPGALNESFSDIFGEVIEAYVKGTNDWILGADFTVQADKNGLRNLSNPNDPNILHPQPDTYQGNYWYNINSVCGRLNDFCGVHINSGVQNYWFYLLSEGGNGTNDQGEDYEVEGIGIDKAAAIAYRNLTVYLTSNSQYADAREGAIQAAKDLHGEDSFEAEQTELAWCAVGIGDCMPPIDCSGTQESDKQVLLDLYKATNGAEWEIPWDTTKQMSEWQGIELNSEGRVRFIRLYTNNLEGTIPSSIGNLCYLETLRLWDNQLSGTIPTTIGKLKNLTRLELSVNSLSGIIPVELYELNNLKGLTLDRNELSGSLSSRISNLVNLQWLNIYNNKFTGSIPGELGELDQLTYLNLTGNQFSGCYHENLLKLCGRFVPGDLHMNGNNFDVPWEDFCASGTSICPPFICSRETDSLALRIMYFAMDGPNWVIPWDLMQPMDTWHGITLDENGRVTCIDLDGMPYCQAYHYSEPGNNLSGIIPPEIGNLCELTYLDLDYNKLTGDIPPEIGQLSKLTNLNLGDNDLSGIIPSEIGDLYSLEGLNLLRNEFSGSIPATIGNLLNLTSLSLGGNYLTGSIPPEIGNLTQLTYLYLGYNFLSGSIPPEIGNLTNLNFQLSLGHNILSGNIPPELGNLSQLVRLSLNNNQLSGPIPPEFCNLTSLEVLFINDNNLSGCYDSCMQEFICGQLASHSWFDGNRDISDDNDFDANVEEFCDSGAESCLTCNRTTDSLALVALYNSTNGPNWTIQWDFTKPMDTWFGVSLDENGRVTCIDLDGIHDCDFEYTREGNKLSGFIPAEIGDLCELTFLDLGDNDFSGSSIPPEIGKLTKLTNLYLQRNDLEGSIPVEFGNLFELRGMSLGANELSGNIPPELGNLFNLVSLALDYNDLTGEIPPELGNLINLSSRLGLSYNHLSGSIPPELGQLIKLNILRLNYNQLSGSIPLELCNLKELSGLDLSHNQLIGNIPACLSSLVDLGTFKVNNNYLSGCYDNDLYTLLCEILPASEYFYGNEDISDDNNFDITWEEFCIDGISNCKSASPVYPGDFNNDGIVNITDLLYWGLAEGETGPVRPNASNAWEAQDCPDWLQEVNDVNCKHQDGNGDGVVDSEDLVTMHDNFDKRHSSKLIAITGSPVQFSLEQVSSTRGNDKTIIDTFNLYVQNDLRQPLNTHGLSCSIFFGDLPFDSVWVDFSNSSLQPDTAMFRYNQDKNTLDIGITRTNKTNIQVDGELTKIIAISHEVDPAEPTFVRIGGGNAMSGNGKLSQVDGSGIFIAPFYEGIDLDTTFPLTVNTTDEHYIRKGSAEAIPLGGQSPYTYEWSTGSTSSKINELKAGEYTVTVIDALNAEATMTFNIFKFGYEMVKCPETRELNVCAPVSPPPSSSLIDFEIINEEHFTGSLNLVIDTLIDVQQNLTSTTYIYTIFDETGMQQTCQTQYHIVNQFLQAPEVSNPGVVCEEELWSDVKIGIEKYIIYKDENGSIGKKLSICETPGLICSTVDFEVDTDLPGTYYFWTTKFIRFPNGEICESDAVRFHVDIEPKPIANLSMENINLEIGDGIALMDLIIENETGYWSGENIIYLWTPGGENIPYFSATSGGIYKLYYTVTNEYCERSYLLIVDVANSGLNEKPILENEPICLDDQFKIFPNPSVNKKLHVIPKCTKNVNTPYSIRIFDLSGNIIVRKEFEDRIAMLNLSAIKKGMYMVELRSPEYQSIQKLLVE